MRLESCCGAVSTVLNIFRKTETAARDDLQKLLRVFDMFSLLDRHKSSFNACHFDIAANAFTVHSISDVINYDFDYIIFI